MSAPVQQLDIIYSILRKNEMTEAIFSSITSKDDVCFNDIYAVVLPKKLCPFGCKKIKCPYDFNIDKCPHNLDEKSIDEVSEYLIKSFYYGDDNIEVDHTKMASPELLKAVQSYRRAGNYTPVDEVKSDK